MRKILFLFLLLLSCSKGFTQGSNGLIAHWDFNGSANDVSGHSLNGVIHNASFVAGYNGTASTALSFNGATSYVQVPYNSLMNTGNAFSVCAFVKVSGFYNGLCQNDFIISRAVPYTPGHFELSMSDNPYDNDCYSFSASQHVFCFGAWNNSTAPVQVWQDTPILVNKWYSIVGTYANDTISLYINGSLRKHFLWGGGLSSPTFEDIYIGMSSTGPGSQYPYPFYGLMDDIRIYNRAISATEVNVYDDSVRQPAPTAIAVNNTPDKKIAISPNPAKEMFTVSLPASENSKHIQLYNMLGELLIEKNIDHAATNTNFDIGAFSAGIYLLKVYIDGEIISQKIIKQ